jgi:hypothetical protein
MFHGNPVVVLVTSRFCDALKPDSWYACVDNLG